MAIASYRVYCSSCDAETVLRSEQVGNTDWNISSLTHHEGECPDCSRRASERDSEPEEIALTELDGIGEKAAQNLREAGYDTVASIAEADDDEILDVSWVGQQSLESLKERAMQLEPQKRWNNDCCQ